MSRPPAAWRPAPREGVSPSRVALPHQGPWTRVLEFLSWRLPRLSEADWRARMARGEVLDESGHPLPPEAAYRPLAKLWYWRQVPDETPIPFQAQILYRDEHLLVADKPHFLPTVPSGRYARETLLSRLQHETGLDSLSPIHRLDRDTAGVVVFSIRPQDRNAYHGVFRDRQSNKVYEAVAAWPPGLVLPLDRESRLAPSAKHFMQVVEVPGEPNAQTRVELIARYGDHAHYRLIPLTGRTHQLRVHMNALGLPLLGDRIYPVLAPEPPPGVTDAQVQPLQLLARSMAFQDPITDEHRHFESRRELTFLSALN